MAMCGCTRWIVTVHDPISSPEFGTVVMQVKAGQERSTAFQQLVRRTGIEDIKSLSATIIQSERFGASLSQALEVYAGAWERPRHGVAAGRRKASSKRNSVRYRDR